MNSSSANDNDNADNAHTPSYTLRPATRRDHELCYTIHEAAMREYVEAIWGWDENFQRELHTRNFDPDTWQIILHDHHPAGSLIVEYRPDEIYLSRIEIDPGFQNHGIGTQAIRDILAEAATLHLPLTLDVLSVNIAAHRLYLRLGFTEVERYGPENNRIRMRHQPD